MSFKDILVSISKIKHNMLVAYKKMLDIDNFYLNFIVKSLIWGYYFYFKSTVKSWIRVYRKILFLNKYFFIDKY